MASITILYRVIHKSLRDFRTRLLNNQDRHGRKKHINRQRISPILFCTRGLGVLAGSTARGYSWRKMAFTVNKKAFGVLEFAKTESIVTVQWRFRIMYHTEPPTDKTIREWYMKFQHSGCLCAAKRSGRPGPSAETVERVRPTPECMEIRPPQLLLLDLQCIMFKYILPPPRPWQDRQCAHSVTMRSVCTITAEAGKKKVLQRSILIWYIC